MGRLQQKAVWQLGLILLLTVSLGGGFSYWLLSEKFADFERKSISSDLNSASALTQEQMLLVSKFTRDYALSDETYAFMESRNQHFIDSDFTFESISNIDVDYVVLLDAKQDIYLSASLILPQRKKAGFVDFSKPPNIIPKLLAQIPDLSAIRETKTGVYFLQNQPFMVSLSPIIKSDGAGDPRGWVFMIRLMSGARLTYLQNITGANFTIEPIPVHGDEGIAFKFNHFNALKFINSWQPFCLRIEGERPLHSQSVATYRLLFLNLLFVWVASLLCVMIGLRRLVINRLNHQCVQLEHICNNQYSGARLIEHGQDEVDSVAKSINVFLAEIERQQQRIMHEALHDNLTGLGNRNRLNEQLQATLSMVRRNLQKAFCFMLLDLDDFKRINDVFGHPAGDFLLVETARRILSITRDMDCAVRLGGDEFAIVFPGIYHIGDAERTAERLREALAQPIPYNKVILQSSASIGLLLIDESVSKDETPENLLKQADIAMYHAKNSGRDKVTVFNQNMEHALLEYARLERDLKHSIANDLLDVYFQPIFTCDGKDIESMEVLGRWFHPELGFISPDRFIPIAENSNLIHEYSMGMLRKACTIAKTYFHIYPKLRLSVNISVLEMLEASFYEDLYLTLLQTDFPPNLLTLEITESLLAKNESELIKPMLQCRNLGIHFHIDDFGTGYSSLARLHSLPIAVLKVDKSFVWRIGNGGDAIVSAVIEIAHGLKLKVVAEGVETEAQLAVLQALGCEYVQGYLYAKPMSVKDACEWLEVFTLGRLAT